MSDLETVIQALQDAQDAISELQAKHAALLGKYNDVFAVPTTPKPVAQTQTQEQPPPPVSSSFQGNA